ncbi:MAG: hypothetical protein AAF467_03915 [Actinomycetota bacterium]
MAKRAPSVRSRGAFHLRRAGVGRASVTWSSFADRVVRERPDHVSVDVFDTCVIRDLLGPEPIENLADRRAGARQGPKRSATAELLESELCRPVPGAADALHRIRHAGVPVTFVSDTERSSASLRALLHSHGLLTDLDALVSSHEWGSTKAAGTLLPAVWASELDRGATIWHLGDNLWSDAVMADEAGLVGFHLPSAAPTRYEEAMAADSRSAGPAVAAAARRARLEIEAEASDGDAEGHARELRVLGAEIGGQVLGSFLLWIAETARREGLSHLLFLARDGELPLKMAVAMPTDHWGDIPLTYMHCSRRSWAIAGAAAYDLADWLHAGTATDTAFINVNRHSVPFSSLLGRIGLTPADVTAHQSLAELAPNEPLPHTLQPEWEALLADTAIGDVIRARATSRKDLITDYLRGLDIRPGRVGIVDVGWRGRLAWKISPIVAEVTGEEPLHLHFGGANVLPDVDEAIDIARFAFDGHEPSRHVSSPVVCIETLTASGKARVDHYERQADGSVVPAFTGRVAAVDHDNRHHLWDGALAVAALIPSRARLAELGCDDSSLRPGTVGLLARWWNDPDRQEALTMADLSFEADDNGHLVSRLVVPYTLRELWSGRTAARQWRLGSAVISARPLSLLLTAFLRLEIWYHHRHPGGDSGQMRLNATPARARRRRPRSAARQVAALMVLRPVAAILARRRAR